MLNFTGRYRIEADRDTVWRGLNDPAILQQAIPGCDSLEWLSPTEMTATVRLALGPVKASFKGQVTLSEIDPPRSYVLTGEGKGGLAGFGSGSAKVVLTADGAVTILAYEAEAKIGGKIAQLGSRLVRGSVIRLTETFFTNFAGALGASVVTLDAETAEDA